MPSEPSSPSVAAVIVAAGSGQRAGEGVAKQWRRLAGARVADHSLAAFRTHPQVGRTVLVVPEDMPDDLRDPAFDADLITPGGATRGASVAAGLAALLPNPPDLVLIHDVARPCVSARIISDVIAALARSPGAAPALPVSDALWRGAQGLVTGTQDRTGLFRAQTPQGFRFDRIVAAHAAFAASAADDVEVARAAGLDVAIVPGDEDNLKITYPPDFDRAARILKARHADPTG